MSGCLSSGFGLSLPWRLLVGLMTSSWGFVWAAAGQGGHTVDILCPKDTVQPGHPGSSQDPVPLVTWTEFCVAHVSGSRSSCWNLQLGRG